MEAACKGSMSWYFPFNVYLLSKFKKKVLFNRVGIILHIYLAIRRGFPLSRMISNTINHEILL